MYEFCSKYHLPIGNSNLPKNNFETSYLLNKLHVLFEILVYDTIAHAPPPQFKHSQLFFSMGGLEQRRFVYIMVKEHVFGFCFKCSGIWNTQTETQFGVAWNCAGFKWTHLMGGTRKPTKWRSLTSSGWTSSLWFTMEPGSCNLPFSLYRAFSSGWWVPWAGLGTGEACDDLDVRSSNRTGAKSEKRKNVGIGAESIVHHALWGGFGDIAGRKKGQWSEAVQGRCNVT